MKKYLATPECQYDLKNESLKKISCIVFGDEFEETNSEYQLLVITFVNFLILELSPKHPIFFFAKINFAKRSHLIAREYIG